MSKPRYGARDASIEPSLLTMVIFAILMLFLYFGERFGAICMLPALLADYVYKKIYRTHNTPSLVRMMLILQGIGAWWLYSTFLATSTGLDHVSSRPNKDIVHSLNRMREHAVLTKQAEAKRELETFAKSDIQTVDHSLIDTQLYGYTNVDATTFIPMTSKGIIYETIGRLPPVLFPDLRYRSPDEIQTKYKTMFSEIPATEKDFIMELKNPCWFRDDSEQQILTSSNGVDFDKINEISCLPYAYLLGMPKCGSTDFYQRLTMHPQITPAKTKENRYFSRGEYSNTSLPREGRFPQPYVDTQVDFTAQQQQEKRLRSQYFLMGAKSSIYEFTTYFDVAKETMLTSDHYNEIISVDGGPHTLWWPTQDADGKMLPEDIPNAQLIREIQPHAKFLMVFADPVRRMYSDYYFLDDNMKPHRGAGNYVKSAKEFHDRTVIQVDKFNKCVSDYKERMRRELGDLRDSKFSIYLLHADDEHDPLWFRASQMCAHDRYTFGKAGWGRIAIGLYSLFLEKWLEHFAEKQFLALRLEDYNGDSKSFMKTAFRFLGVRDDDDLEWGSMLLDFRFNVNRLQTKEEMLPETEKLLRDFYRPYNEILDKLVSGNGKFRWEEVASNSQEGKSQQNPRVLDEFSINQHDPAHRTAALHHEEDSESSSSSQTHLRRQPDVPVQLLPKNFDLAGLQLPESYELGELMNQFNVLDLRKDWRGSASDAAKQVCYAAFSLDFYALKYLLYDVGVPADLKFTEDGGRSALHCLAMLRIMVEGHTTSHVFALLKGIPTWLTKLEDASLPLQINSVHTHDILDGISDPIKEVAKWLIRAGTDLSAVDDCGNTFMHYVGSAGLESLIEVTLPALEKRGVAYMEYFLNVQNNENRTALHYAAATGSVEVLEVLVRHGGNLHLADSNGVKPIDMIENPGIISAEDALNRFGITQRAVKQLPNRRHHQQKRNQRAQQGGWSTKVLEGYEDDLTCEVDQFDANEITSKEIFDKYIARNMPILVRGMIDDWEVNDLFRLEKLNRTYGHMQVTASDIPYSGKFGGEGEAALTLSEYIKMMKDHNILGGAHPWYVFRAHRIPWASENPDFSIVPYETCPTPQVIFEAFLKYHKPYTNHTLSIHPQSREIFANAQWALGGPGTGAPVHFHNTAWAAVIYGAKKWVIYPPRHQVMSNRQILHFMETDKVDFDRRGVVSKTCVQLAGDVMIIPESWGHGVLNIKDTIAMATEVKTSLWKLKLSSKIASKLPFHNNAML